MKNVLLIMFTLLAAASTAPVAIGHSSSAGRSADSASAAGSARSAGSAESGGRSSGNARSARSADNDNEEDEENDGQSAGTSADNDNEEDEENDGQSAGTSAGCSGSQDNTGNGLAESNGTLGVGNGRDCGDEGVTGTETEAETETEETESDADGNAEEDDDDDDADDDDDDDNVEDTSTDDGVFPLSTDVFPIIGGGGGGSDVGGGDNGGNSSVGGDSGVAPIPLALFVNADFDSVFGTNPSETTAQFGEVLVGAFQSALNTEARPALLRVSRGSIIITIWYAEPGVQAQLEQLAVDCGLAVSFGDTDFALSTAAVSCAVDTDAGEGPTEEDPAASDAPDTAVEGDQDEDGEVDQDAQSGASSDTTSSASSGNATGSLNAGTVAGVLVALGMLLVLIGLLAKRRSHAKEKGEDATIDPERAETMHWSFDDAGTTKGMCHTSPNLTYQANDDTYAEVDDLLDNRVSGQYYVVGDDDNKDMYCENPALYASPSAVSEVTYDVGSPVGAYGVGAGNGQETCIYDTGAADYIYDTGAADEPTEEDAFRQAAAILEMDMSTLRRDKQQRSLRGIDMVYDVADDDKTDPVYDVSSASERKVTRRHVDDATGPVYDVGSDSERKGTLRRDGEENADPAYDVSTMNIGELADPLYDVGSAGPVYDVSNAPTLRRDEASAANAIYDVGDALGRGSELDGSVEEPMYGSAELDGSAEEPMYDVGNAPTLRRDELGASVEEPMYGSAELDGSAVEPMYDVGNAPTLRRDEEEGVEVSDAPIYDVPGGIGSASSGHDYRSLAQIESPLYDNRSVTAIADL